MSEWQPIDTLPIPKETGDHCDYIFYHPSRGVFEGWCVLDEDPECLRFWKGDYCIMRPTHWMNLPEPPKE